MPRIVLKDLETDKTLTVSDAEATLGRDPASSVVAEGPKSKVVSGNHARIFLQDDAWWIEDTSRNGTVLDDERLRKGVRHAIKVGQTLGLGESGPRYRVMVLEARRVAETMVESATPPKSAPSTPSSTAPLKQAAAVPVSPPPAPPAAASGAADNVSTMAMRRSDAIRAGLHLPEETTEPMAPAPDWAAHVVLRETHSNQHWDVRGDSVKLGRSTECLVQIPAEHGASVSRVHAEILVMNGGITVRDMGSRNGTFLNGKRLTEPGEVRRADLIMLGAGGPTFSVEDLHIVKGVQPAPAAPSVSPAPAAGVRGAAAAAGSPTPAKGTPAADRPSASQRPAVIKKGAGPATNLARRSFAGVGRTAFFKDVLEDMSQKSAKRVRVIVWSSVAATIVIAGVLLWATQRRVAASERLMQQERVEFNARADSIRQAAVADAARLRSAFDSARTSSAPRAVLDSLRDALADATRRTGMLEEALSRARQSLDRQLAAGDSARRNAEAELGRLRSQVSRAQDVGEGRATMDSLRRMLHEAEVRATEMNSQLRAVRGADLAQVATLNQSAVGLVSTFLKSGNEEGTGFAITPSGYFITNRHVVANDDGQVADSVYVTMADNRYASPWLRADIVVIGDGDVDIAILKLRNYRAAYIKKIDWDVSTRQGEPAALIGFPRGTMMALDNRDTVRTTMTAGIFSKVSSSRIQFDGFSQGGSSGSPVFNADGEVVAVHFAGLKGTVGMGFAIPIARVLPLLPADAKRELGLR